MGNNSLDFAYINGYNKKYYITKEGKVFITNYRNTGKTKEMKPRVIAGYYALGLESPESSETCRKQKIHKIHRLLAEHFIPNPENKPCVNHKDGNKLNNSLDNLEWCTISENTRHAYANKLERNFWSKELGIACITLIEDFRYNFADVARLFNLPSRANVSWFWNNGYKTFGLKHSNPFIPKHSRKLQISDGYREYIHKLLKDNTVLNISLNGKCQCNE